MNKVIDLEQRQHALDASESFIVQAPAGSGKTELLIQRYLRILAIVNAPEEIIAITFTRKAAAQMRERVINALEAVAKNRPAKDAAAELTHKLAMKVSTQDAKEGWQLADNPGRLRIQTIDSLTASLTRQMPVLSGFGAQPETIEDARELYQQAATHTLAELESDDAWAEAIALLLRHLDNDLPRLRNMLASMLARRDQWLRHIPKQHQRQQLEAALTHLVESELAQVQQCLSEQYHEELVALLRFAAANLHADDSDSIIIRCLDIEKMPGCEAGELNKWQAISHLLFTQSGSWRLAANVKLGFPAASGNKADSEIRKDMKTRFNALIANLSAEDGLGTPLLELKYLPPTRYSDSEWDVVEALYRLLILADAQLRILFAEANQMDFSGITQAAIQALGETEAPTDLALQLDYQIKHILVDEFQDISINQYNLLEKLTAGWSMADGRSLFLVGDPMQSIYRFREAEVGLFLNTWEQRRLNQVALTPLNITVNFRSEPGIVDWVNRAFKQVLPEHADISRGAVKYVNADAFHAETVAEPVQLHPIVSRDDGKEAALVLQIINESRQNDAQASIAILVRNRSHLQEIIRALHNAALPYRAVEIEALGQRPAIQDLLSLTLAMTHLADRIAWLALLRAPCCGLTLLDLHQLVADDKALSVWDCMQDPLRVAALSEAGRQRVIKIAEILKNAFIEQGRRRLSRWIESTWMIMGGPACLENESDLENSLTFFRLLDDYDKGAVLKDREAFTGKVASLYAAPDIGSEDAVQIMTIHKAKGLEFDTVVLPGLSRGSGADEARLLLWMERPRGMHQDLLLAPIKEAGQSDSLIYNYLKRLESEKQACELGRLLYVATTRAKKHLHIIATAESDKKDEANIVLAPRRNSLLGQLWPVVKELFEDEILWHKADSEVEKADIPVSTHRLRRLTSSWILPLPPARVEYEYDNFDEGAEAEFTPIEYEWAGETIKHIGTVVHRCIHWMADEHFESWDERKIEKSQHLYRRFLKQLGVPDKELSGSARQVQQALTNMLTHQRGQWLFSKDHKEARNEYAIGGVYQDKIVKVILDRTFIDNEGTRWVVDYKTSRHEGADIDAFLDQQQQRYRQQLEKYAELINAMENTPIKLGLYFPLLQGWREWKYNWGQTRIYEKNN